MRRSSSSRGGGRGLRSRHRLFGVRTRSSHAPQCRQARGGLLKPLHDALLPDSANSFRNLAPGATEQLGHRVACVCAHFCRSASVAHQEFFFVRLWRQQKVGDLISMTNKTVQLSNYGLHIRSCFLVDCIKGCVGDGNSVINWCGDGLTNSRLCSCIIGRKHRANLPSKVLLTLVHCFQHLLASIVAGHEHIINLFLSHRSSLHAIIICLLGILYRTFDGFYCIVDAAVYSRDEVNSILRHSRILGRQIGDDILDAFNLSLQHIRYNRGIFNGICR
mmetsp:Transcript_8200/g.13291  ORF Transcript_8200/g.13291 Transcript_8200/m.13291 type:complete len:276 (-) Transcript_8200:179-1006(-)